MKTHKQPAAHQHSADTATAQRPQPKRTTVQRKAKTTAKQPSRQQPTQQTAPTATTPNANGTGANGTVESNADFLGFLRPDGSIRPATQEHLMRSDKTGESIDEILGVEFPRVKFSNDIHDMQERLVIANAKLWTAQKRIVELERLRRQDRATIVEMFEELSAMYEAKQNTNSKTTQGKTHDESKRNRTKNLH